MKNLNNLKTFEEWNWNPFKRNNKPTPAPEPDTTVDNKKIVDPETQELFNKIDSKIRNNFNPNKWYPEKNIYRIGNIRFTFFSGYHSRYNVYMYMSKVREGEAGPISEYVEQIDVDPSQIRSLIEFIKYNYNKHMKKSLHDDLDQITTERQSYGRT